MRQFTMQSSRSNRRSRSHQQVVEAMEARRLMAVAATVSSNTLFVFGDSNNNGISVETAGTNLVVKEYQGAAGYQTIFTTPYALVGAIKVYGYAGADTLTIADTVQQGAWLMGGPGGDYLKAGGGNAKLWGHGDWTSDITGQHRADTDDGAADTIVSGLGESLAEGQKGNDQFYANASTNEFAFVEFRGGDGNDTFTLNGRAGTYSGGKGNDRFNVQPGNRRGIMNGGPGNDTVDFSTYDTAVRLEAEQGKLSGPLNGFGGRKMQVNQEVETLIGTGFGDTIIGNQKNNTIYGGGGNDIISGAAGRDYIEAGAGGDIVSGGYDEDTIFGNAGNDYLSGDEKNDVLKGDAGNDSLRGNGGNDWLFGGTDNDDLKGGSGNDSLYGEAGNDHLKGEAGTDLHVGGEGSDYIDAKDATPFELVFGNNQDGSGGLNAFDIVLADRVFNGGTFLQDNVAGAESVSF
jgi:Ca2+-binding RTX toxin-like protein